MSKQTKVALVLAAEEYMVGRSLWAAGRLVEVRRAITAAAVARDELDASTADATTRAFVRSIIG